MIKLFRRKKEEEPKEASIEEDVAKQGLPVMKPQITISPDEAENARKELRLLEVERDIAQYALTKIYEAEAGGKISEGERDTLAGRYKDQVKTLEERMSFSRMLVDLRELEVGQSELVKMFYDKFTELDKRIHNVRTRLGHTPTPMPGIAPPEETAGARPTPPPSAQRRAKGAKPPEKEAPPRTRAEMELEKLQEEVKKALEKLEQIELES